MFGRDFVAESLSKEETLELQQTARTLKSLVAGMTSRLDTVLENMGEDPDVEMERLAARFV